MTSTPPSPTAPPPMLGVEELVKDYPGHPGAVAGVSLSARDGEFLTLLGPSGCGKSTILRCVAGLEDPTAGRIEIGGGEVFGPAGRVPTYRRNIGMVFQSYAIWPHMTVRQNVEFPLPDLPRAEARKRADEALRMVDLERFGDRPATMLSGGQQQRVAFARAVVRGADLLLLDEPLSNLDAALRGQMRSELRDLQQRLGTTTVYVTHDQEEALSLSDRIVVLDQGRVVEVGTPQQLYVQPTTAFTAAFVGQAQLWPCTAVDPGGRVHTPLGTFTVAGPVPTGECSLLIRPEYWQVTPASPAASPSAPVSPSVPVSSSGPAPPAAAAPVSETVRRNSVHGQVQRVTFGGKLLDVEVMVGPHLVRTQQLAGQGHQVGDTVELYAPPERCVLVAGAADLADPSGAAAPDRVQ